MSKRTFWKILQKFPKFLIYGKIIDISFGGEKLYFKLNLTLQDIISKKGCWHQKWSIYFPLAKNNSSGFAQFHTYIKPYIMINFFKVKKYYFETFCGK